MSSVSKKSLIVKLVAIPVAGIVLATMIAILLAYAIGDNTLRQVLTAVAHLVVMAVTAGVFWFSWRDHAGLTAIGEVSEQSHRAVRPIIVSGTIFIALNDSSWLTLFALRGDTRVAAELALITASFVVVYALYRHLQVVDAAEAAAGMPSPEEHS